MKILTEVESNDNGGQSHGVLVISPHPFVEFRELEILFNRLDYQVAQVCLRSFPLPSAFVYSVDLTFRPCTMLTPAQMIGTPPMLLKTRPRDIENGFCPDIPSAFTSLEQARNSLDYHWNSCTGFLGEAEHNRNTQSIAITSDEPADFFEMIETPRKEMFGLFQKWLVSFQLFLQSRGKSLDSRGLQAARSLEITHSIAIIFLNVSTVYMIQDEMIWDSSTEHFKHVVNLATYVIESSIRDKANQKRGPDFTLDMHTVGPLYAVAHRCRHPIIRRKAVSLLYALPRQEGVWDSVLTARVAERLIGIEESGLGIVTRCEDVPDWARISDVEVKFDLEESQGTVKFSRQRSPLEKVRETVIDSFRW